MKIIDKTIDDNSVLILEGDRNIYVSDCEKREYYFSNNDGGLKNIAFLLKDKKNISLDFHGAKLIFNGRILPFVIDGCDDVTLKNLTINYDRPFYSQADIISVSGNSMVIRMDEGFPYKIENEGLVFTSATWENDTSDCWVLMQEFDPLTRSLAIDSVLRIGRFGKNTEKDPLSPLPMVTFTARDLGNNLIELNGDDDISHYRAGFKLIMTHEKRECPAIAITRSKNIKIENVNIVHAGSMGLIAQLSENISITGLNVRLFEGLSCGLVSTNCDATHFVNCRGLIRINKSVFNNMMDDGVNIHGVYTEAVRTEGNCVWLKIMHFQQYGINFYAENDIIAVHERSTVATRGVYTVAKSELTAPDIIKVTFKELPQIEAGDFVDNVSMHPDVIIENTETGFNRPRGFLLTTNGNVIIRNNVFNSCSYGIHIAGDMTYWFESTGTKNVLIEDNIFRNNCVQFGDYSIAITPEYEETTKEEYFHENIKIRNNKFYSFVPGAVYAKGVDGLEITGNLLEKSYDYYRKSSAPAVETINCRNVIIDKNIF